MFLTKAVQKTGHTGTWIYKGLIILAAVTFAFAIQAMPSKNLPPVFANEQASLVATDAIFHIASDGEIYFLDQQHNVMQIRSGKGAAVPVSGIHKNEQAFALFQHRDDGAWHIVTLISNPDRDPVDPTQMGLPNGERLDALQAPDWGSDQIYQLYRLTPNTGNARRIAIRASKGDAGSVPGHSVLSDFWQERGTSHINLFETQHCSVYGAVFTGRTCHAGNLSSASQTAFRKSITNNCAQTSSSACQPGLVTAVDCPGCRFRLWHGVTEGDALLPVRPIHLEDRETGLFTSIDSISADGSRPEQADIVHLDHFVAVRLHGPQSQPAWVINLKSGHHHMTSAPAKSLYWLAARKISVCPYFAPPD